MAKVSDPRMTEQELYDLLQDAHFAGMVAAKESVPTPMVVSEHASPLDDTSRVTRSWYVSEGVCGFAWIKIHPGTSRLARAAKRFMGARSSYGGGVDIWVSEFGQSMTRKEAYADAFARTLRAAGFSRVYAQSRMD